MREPETAIVDAIKTGFRTTVLDGDTREGGVGGQVADGDEEGVDAFVLETSGI